MPANTAIPVAGDTPAVYGNLVTGVVVEPVVLEGVTEGVVGVVGVVVGGVVLPLPGVGQVFVMV